MLVFAQFEGLYQLIRLYFNKLYKILIKKTYNKIKYTNPKNLQLIVYKCSKNNKSNILSQKITSYRPECKNITVYKGRNNFSSLRSLQVALMRKDISLQVPPCINNFVPSDDISEEVTMFIKQKNLNPILIYENLNAGNIRDRVISETRDLSGIYLILNKDRGDYYIGSASTGKFNSRFRNHLFNFNGSKILKNAVKKYKISAFAFMVLETYPQIVTKENNKKLLDLEDFYLKSLLPNYNILTEAGSCFGYRHTEITRLNMKANYSEERRMAVGSLNKTFCSETIEVNRTKPVYSNEAIANMKKKSKPIVVYNLDYTVFGEFASMIEGSKYLGCDQKNIRRALQSKKKILRRR